MAETFPVQSLEGARLEILPLQIEDLDLIFPIELRCFSSPWARESFELALRQPTVQGWVGWLGGRPAGYVLGSLVAGHLLVANLAVDVWARRRGIGRRLLAHVLENASRRGAQWAYLDVRPSNEAAIRLYRDLGFRTVGRRPNYYTAPREDSLIMMREI
jgi:ribosomal-protein-alanine N-acetyltransferase